MMDNPLLQDIRTKMNSGAFADPIPLQLPTLGKFYDEGVVEDHVKDEDWTIEVGFLSLIDEHNYSDPIMLGTGKALRNIIKNVAPEIIDPLKLNQVDIDAILIATRMASRGQEMKFTQNCAYVNEDGQSCGHENTLALDLMSHIGRYGALGSESAFIDEELFTLHIEELNQTVHLKLPEYGQTLRLMFDSLRSGEFTKKYSEQVTDPDQFMDQDSEVIRAYEKYLEDIAQNDITSMQTFIADVTRENGDVYDDVQMINMWLRYLPTTIAKKVAERINDITVKINALSRIDFECSECGYVNSVTLNLDQERLFLSASEVVNNTPFSKNPENTEKPKKTSQKASRKSHSAQKVR